MKTRMFMIGLGFVLIMLNACTKDNTTPGITKVTLIAKSSESVSTLKSALLSPATDSLLISDFLVHVREIEFGTEDSENEHMEDSLHSELKFEGSYLFDLIQDGTLGEQVLGQFDVPNNRYNKLEVKLNKYPEDGEDTLMQGKTFYIAGIINAQPFEFWSDLTDELEVEFPDSSSFQLTGNDLSLYIDFHIDQIRAALLGAGFAAAIDGNGNGVIEINPENPDGNRDLYRSIQHLIKKSVDMDNDDSNENDESHHQEGNHG
ncbi:MAG: hypothetical protein GXO83_00470 [Chlorobi bacterium]|nr:hypothetical protein [Chlorobiota bacterium]